MAFSILSLSALLAASACAQSAAEGAPAAAAPDKTPPELDAEIEYVEALVNNGYPDFAAPVIEAAKKKWPQSEATFFAIEVRGLLALG